MGLRSGLCDGHSNTLTLLSLSFSATDEHCDSTGRNTEGASFVLAREGKARPPMMLSTYQQSYFSVSVYHYSTDCAAAVSASFMAQNTAL